MPPNILPQNAERSQLDATPNEISISLAPCGSLRPGSHLSGCSLIQEDFVGIALGSQWNCPTDAHQLQCAFSKDAAVAPTKSRSHEQPMQRRPTPSPAPALLWDKFFSKPCSTPGPALAPPLVQPLDLLPGSTSGPLCPWHYRNPGLTPSSSHFWFTPGPTLASPLAPNFVSPLPTFGTTTCPFFPDSTPD